MTDNPRTFSWVGDYVGNDPNNPASYCPMELPTKGDTVVFRGTIPEGVMEYLSNLGVIEKSDD